MTTVTTTELVGVAPSTRPAADRFMRSLLRIPEQRPSRRRRDVHGIFSISIVISALRCIVTYVALPLIAPIFGAAAGAGPEIGVPISVVALVFDVRGVRRFWLANHKYRWQMTGIYLAVMAMVTTFLVIDCIALAR